MPGAWRFSRGRCVRAACAALRARVHPADHVLAAQFCLICITVLFRRNAMFQASLALGVLAISFGVHAKTQAFVTSDAQDAAFAAHHGGLRREKLTTALERQLESRVCSLPSLGERTAVMARVGRTTSSTNVRDGGTKPPTPRRRSSVQAATVAATVAVTTATVTAVQAVQLLLGAPGV